MERVIKGKTEGTGGRKEFILRLSLGQRMTEDNVAIFWWEGPGQRPSPVELDLLGENHARGFQQPSEGQEQETLGRWEPVAQPSLCRVKDVHHV